MAVVYLIWRTTFENGVRIGTVTTEKNPVFYGTGIGTTRAKI